jgi:hypothetical protein
MSHQRVKYSLSDRWHAQVGTASRPSRTALPAFARHCLRDCILKRSAAGAEQMLWPDEATDAYRQARPAANCAIGSSVDGGFVAIVAGAWRRLRRTFSSRSGWSLASPLGSRNAAATGEGKATSGPNSPIVQGDLNQTVNNFFRESNGQPALLSEFESDVLIELLDRGRGQRVMRFQSPTTLQVGKFVASNSDVNSFEKLDRAVARLCSLKLVEENSERVLLLTAPGRERAYAVREERAGSS